MRAITSRQLGAAVAGAVLIAFTVAVAGCSSPGSTARPAVTHTVTRCTTDHLSGTIGERNGAPLGSGSGMNQQHVAIILSNTGSATCTLQGWPGVYAPSECHVANADGLRVYPPGSRTSLFIADELRACTLSTHDLLTVGAFVPYP